MDQLVCSIREILLRNGHFAGNAAGLGLDDNLFDLGMSSFQAVQLMMALEDGFDLQFPDDLIRKETFASIRAMAEAVDFVLAGRLAVRRAV